MISTYKVTPFGKNYPVVLIKASNKTDAYYKAHKDETLKHYNKLDIKRIKASNFKNGVGFPLL